MTPSLLLASLVVTFVSTLWCMPRARPVRRRVLGGLLLLVASAPGAMAAEAVLLASTAPGYAPGMVVVAGDRLVLPDGASATLLFRSGEMLRLRGPFDGTLEHAQKAPDDASPSALAEVLRMQGVDASVIGGTRAIGAGFRPPADEDVVVDPQRSGTYCLAPSASVWLGHPAREDETWGLRRGGNLRVLAWNAGAGRTEWPSDVPIEDGDRFEIVADGTAKATVAFRLLDERYDSLSAWIAAGVLAGCGEQFVDRLHQLARSAAPPELWLSSDRGRHPTYRSGEAVPLTVQADTGGYLYCVAVSAGERAVPIFPAGAIDGARVRAAEPVSIPGNRAAAALHVGPKGTEQVRCWLADRDISPELPHALLDPGAARLPDRLAADLDDVFGRIGGNLVKTTLTIQVQ